ASQVPAPEDGKIDAASLTHVLTLERTNPSSILSCVAAARENLRQVREQCSTEMWEQLNRLHLQVNSTTASEVWLLNTHVFFRAVQEGAHLFQGVTDSTMSHGEGWQYIQLGRFVERTDELARLIGTHFGRLPHPLDQAVESEEYLEWVGLLKSCAAFEAYCKTYTAEIRPLRVAEFLLLNPEFPHSVRFSVDRVHAALVAIGELTERKAEQPVRLARTPLRDPEFQPDRRNHGPRREWLRRQHTLEMRASAYRDSASLFRLLGRISTGFVAPGSRRLSRWRLALAPAGEKEESVIYSARHPTTFRYEPAVRESVMEVRLQPRSDGEQRCLSFMLNVDPAANVMQYRDFTGNTVHHFDIAGTHKLVKVTAQSAVEVQSVPPPRTSSVGDWADLDALIAGNDYWEMLLPSHFAHSNPELENLAKELRCERRGNPLVLLTELNEAIYKLFAYVPNSTKVDSPIEEALRTRQGVCQDFAHIMIALVRRLHIPCRYVSGYMFHRDEPEKDRSLEGASHAWVEALVPGLGWVAFDPTNNLVGGDRHIRIAIGRDYADVPPTRGVYKGEAQSDLSVAVTVSPADTVSPEPAMPPFVVRSRPVLARPAARSEQEQQQQ